MMDTSKEYITMCEKTEEEIQKLWKRQGGDFYTIGGEKVYFYFGLDDSDMLWLPRQDQLQEIIAGKGAGRYILLMNDFLTFMKKQSAFTFTSLEQLWLAFVMKEKYNKIWDSKKKEWREE